MKKNKLRIPKPTIFAVTGTYNGSIVTANSEGEARRIFHKAYNGESIIHIKPYTLYHRLNNL